VVAKEKAGPVVVVMVEEAMEEAEEVEAGLAVVVQVVVVRAEGALEGCWEAVAPLDMVPWEGWTVEGAAQVEEAESVADSGPCHSRLDRTKRM
jgi:hypothetical protein